MNPTVADGDFQVSTDDGAYQNVNAYAVSPAGTAGVKITLSSTQMNGDIVMVRAVDQTAPKEWCDFGLCILTTAA